MGMIVCSVKEACKLMEHMDENDTVILTVIDKKTYLHDVQRRIKKKSSEEETTSKKDDKLLKYLEEPNNNTILIFTINSKIDSKKKICKTIKERYKLIQLDDLKPKEIYNKLEKSLTSEYLLIQEAEKSPICPSKFITKPIIPIIK